MTNNDTVVEADLTGFPIRELSRRTAVKASTLRAWETRHDLLQPQRTESGHRLYSEADVERVLYLQELIAEGHPLAEAAKLLGQGVPAGRSKVTASDPEQLPSVWETSQLAILDATARFDDLALDETYGNACSVYPLEMVNQRLLIPVLEQLGERWRVREAGIAEEHFFSAWLRNKLGARLHLSSTRNSGSKLVCASLPGERHEIGLLVFALSAISRGYQVIYLGADMPIRQIKPVVTNTNAQAVVLAGRDASHAGLILPDIAWLAGQIAAPVFIGSHFAQTMKAELKQAGALAIGSDILAGLARIEARLAANPARLRAASLHP